jgi:hypothetical protein
MTLPSPNTIASLASYITHEDGVLTREQFLQVVADRIIDDLARQAVTKRNEENKPVFARDRIKDYLHKVKSWRTTSQIADACFITIHVARRLLWEYEERGEVEVAEREINDVAGKPLSWIWKESKQP